nr:TlpA disulfide reductase family protein [Micromonospora sp. DSM 115978]
MRRTPALRPTVLRTAAATAATAAVVALAGCTGGGWEESCETTPEGIIECAAADRPAAPDVAGELLDGTAYDLSQDRGQVVVVNFWGSWCAPCRAEADDLEQTFLATRESGVRFLGINIQDSRDKARAFEEGRVSYPSLFDPGSRLALDFEVPPNTIPATIVLDRDGRIAVVIRSAVRQQTLEPIVARVAGESPAADGPR